MNGAEKYSNNLGGAFGISTDSEIYVGVDVSVNGRSYLGGIVGSANNTKIYFHMQKGMLQELQLEVMVPIIMTLTMWVVCRLKILF